MILKTTMKGYRVHSSQTVSDEFDLVWSRVPPRPMCLSLEIAAKTTGWPLTPIQKAAGWPLTPIHYLQHKNRD
jgi:hypothetical protein